MSWSDALFRPRRVAVYGSTSPGKIGRVIIDQLLEGGFPHVVAVNPKAQGIPGIAAASSLSEIDLPVDLAVVASPAATVLDVLEDAGRAEAKAAIVITAGFSEASNALGELEILKVAQSWGLRVVGPNCAGIVNTKHGLFPTLETRPPTGDVAFVSQSGALGGAVLSWAEEQGVGFSKFVSYGNAVDLTEIDFLDTLRNDDESKVVCLYIETVSDGRAFLRAAAAVAAVKPLIVIKSGRSESGGRATLSHTGSMAGTDAVYDAALRQCGAIRAAGIEEMFDLCRGFVALPPMAGRRLAIVTNSGGPGVLAADRAEVEGLEIARPSEELRERLQERLPSFCGFENPFDLTVQGDGDAYRDVLTAALAEYDGALAINVNVPYLDSAPLARGVVEAAEGSDKPIAACFMAGQPAAAALPVLDVSGVPVFSTGERAARALSALVQHAERVAHTEGARGDERLCPSSGWLGSAPRTPERLPWERNPLEPEGMDWLEKLGFPVIERRWARTADEAAAAARAFDRPIAMKVVSPSIVHKTDVGGVILNVTGEDEAISAFGRLHVIAAGCDFQGVLVTPMIADAMEVLVGLSTDPQFGPVVAVGLGGIFAETMRDLSLRIAPISGADAREMIGDLRGRELLHGARGRPPCDVSALGDVIARISHLPFEFPGIRELDLNPIFCLERGCAIVDVRLVRRDAAAHSEQEEAAP